ncbi:MAG TPA: ABC transporter ATP-binding protein [Verrucomicrobiae bacterium]|jgi:ABC-type lipoprotein export system ATPase subunit|nr:ABC transporter ATP-binding protein [Verrucomicrobiae bacterium]
MDLTQAKPSAPQTPSSLRHTDLLQLREVSKTYVTDGEPVHALNGVSFTLGAGDFVALVGRSGCGKSTLLNLSGAMDFPTTGQVLLDGVSTSELDDNGLTRLRRGKVGFIFQAFQLLNTLSVLENVELPLLLAGESKTAQRAGHNLQLVELADLGNRMPHQLSGGQMQRVAIARAMVHDPKLLLADEPTGNLDTQTGNMILDLLRRIANQQKTAVLMATHSMEAANIADAVVRMRDGRIEEVIRR